MMLLDPRRKEPRSQVIERGVDVSKLTVPARFPKPNGGDRLSRETSKVILRRPSGSNGWSARARLFPAAVGITSSPKRSLGNFKTPGWMRSQGRDDEESPRKHPKSP